MTAANDEVQYLVLPDATNPYFLARVRWPDVCQAITPACPSWQDDPGLFDLPYDPNSTPVTFDEAAAIAGAWDARLPSDAAPAAPAVSLMRRMPADWSNLSRAEKRAWSIEFMTTGKAVATDREGVLGGDVATPRSRFGRWRLRRRAVRPALDGAELPGEELILDDAAASDEFVHAAADSVLVLDEEPANVIRGADARVGGDDHVRAEDDDVVIDLTETVEEAPASVDDVA